jgi:2-keto-4-pentenoate hydratase
MTDWTIERTAEVLLEAERDRADRGPNAAEWPSLDLATAYRAQDVPLERRKAAGETVIGVKPGLTSRAEQRRMGIGAPLTAWPTDAMALPDVVADNASSARFGIGPAGPAPGGLDLSLLGRVLEADGQVVDTATGAAVQGHPGQVPALAANSLAGRDLAPEAGWIVLTGGTTDAVPLRRGSSVTVRFAGLGGLTVAGV